MKLSLVFPLTLALCLSLSAAAQERGGARGGGGQRRAPEPPIRREPGARPEVEQRDRGRMNSMPHVRDNHWYGHEAPDDRLWHEALTIPRC